MSSWRRNSDHTPPHPSAGNACAGKARPARAGRDEGAPSADRDGDGLRFAVRLYEEALALEAAGCFAIVLEAVPAPVATRITEALSIPTIGIGAGAGTDGQVLVWHDLLGLYEGHAPRFVKQYADLAEAIKTAVGTYVDEVRERRFPEERHTYSMPAEELALFEEALEDVRERR